jgi:inward rectifier potassium channel
MKKLNFRPTERIKNIYYHLMNMSWIKLILLVTVAFLFINLVFSSLYYFFPVTVSNIEDNSFISYFFFSVQTLSTIGYGHFTPIGVGANLLVTLSALTGMVFVATITGVTFAKFSRPISQIIFSNKVVITEVDGEKVLCFRVGNKRGNDIVDASVKVTALIYHETKEGEKVRKMIDLDLKRSNTPFFALSWTIFHSLENSPLDLDNLLGISALIIGHDGTYSQTIYARRLYFPNEIVKDTRFEDVIYVSDSGETQVNFDKFHDTI